MVIEVRALRFGWLMIVSCIVVSGQALAAPTEDVSPNRFQTLENLVGYSPPLTSQTPSLPGSSSAGLEMTSYHMLLVATGGSAGDGTPPDEWAVTPGWSSGPDTFLGRSRLPDEKPTPKFGTPGTTRVLFVPLMGKAVGEPEWFYILNLEVDHFFLQNTCVNLHLQGIYYDQPGPATVGYGPAVTLRRYFYVRPSGNLFVAGGVGLNYSDNPVPEVVGSKLNFTPRAAIGFSRELFAHTRVVGGLRVIHSQGLGRSDHARTILQPFLGLNIVLY